MFVDKKNRRVYFTRRQMLKGAGAAAGALAAGSVLKEPLKTLGQLADPNPAQAATFYKGADVSWLQQMEANGYKFFTTSGVQEDCLTILKSYNVNAIRLRTWVNPSSDPVNGHCSQSETIAMAVTCKNAGLPIIVDFHFGDTWNDVGHQNPPAAWASFSYSQMLTAVQNYVSGFMKAMQSAGVTPGWVQTGNEINSGLLHPVGGVNFPSQMTGLINTAHDQIKAVFPNTPVIVHLAQPQKSSGITTMLNAFTSNGGKWDILGFSSYGSSSLASGLATTMINFGKQYGKPVMQVETGGPTSSSGTPTAVTEYIQGIRNGGGLGVFYWEPEVYAPFDTYGSGAWNTNGEPIAAIMNAVKNA
jgi:arabinogalactan endo-1,4-beta-galactosidase